MILKRLPLVVLLLAGLLAGPVPDLRAQEEPEGWSVRPHVDVGWMIPLRNMGKNSTILGSQGSLQVVAEMNSALMYGGGIEVDVPDRRLRVRATLRRTAGLTVDGVLSICQTDLIEPGGLCLVQESDATVTEGGVDLLLLSRDLPQGRLSPIVFLGVGLRHIQFDNDPSVCDALDPGDERAICVGIRRIWEVSSTDPIFSFGGGLQANLAPVEAFAQLRAIAGEFGGGTQGADGETLVDVLFSGGLSFRIF